MPLLPAGGSPSAAPLGAATFAVEQEPAAGDVETLCALCASLATSIQHHTKALWEARPGAYVQPKHALLAGCAANEVAPLAHLAGHMA